jgi:phage gpG-like protein
MDDNLALGRRLEAIEREFPILVAKIPQVIRVEGLQFIADNFRNQGFEKSPGNVDKWKKKAKADSKKPVLIGEKRGGALRRSWQGQATTSQAIFSSNKPYAGVHNEGLKAGRPPGFTMPVRQMIGPSAELNARIEAKLDKLMDSLIL